MCVYGRGKGLGKAEVKKEKMMTTGRAIMGMGKVSAQLPLQCPKPHLSKISTMVQAKRRRPSGICKATARQSTDMRAEAWEEAGMATLPLTRPGNFSTPKPGLSLGAHPFWLGPAGSSRWSWGSQSYNWKAGLEWLPAAVGCSGSQGGSDWPRGPEGLYLG